MIPRFPRPLTFVLGLATLSGMAFSGCDEAAPAGADESAVARGPLGKADAAGSCAAADDGDYCGGQSGGRCWCDDLCVDHGDCCSDRALVCDGEPDSPTVFHVAPHGRDHNPGTATAPFRTLGWALRQARGHETVDTVAVAEGIYGLDVANGETLVMAEGVSLIGGYSPDFSRHDPSLHHTSLRDSSAALPGLGNSVPSHLLEAPAGLSRATVVEGFEIAVGRGCALLVRGDATVRNNRFYLDDTPVTGNQCAISVEYGAPLVVGNRIEFQSAAPHLWGIRTYHSDGVFAGNLISLVGGTRDRTAFQLRHGAPQILGNTLYSDATVNSTLVAIYGARAEIRSNLMENGSDLCVGAYTVGASLGMASLHDNVLGCSVLFHAPEVLSTPRPIYHVAELEERLAEASGNLKFADPVVSPGEDFRLDADTPCSVTRGGLDPSGVLEVDLMGTPRTRPLSIGAHEWDGRCR